MTPLLLSILLLATPISQSSKDLFPKWLRGEWQADPKATQEALKEGMTNPDLGDFISALIVAGLTAPQTHFKIDITNTEMLVSVNGNKKSTIVSGFENNGDICTLKRGDGEITHFHRSKNGFWIFIDDRKTKIYFKK